MLNPKCVTMGELYGEFSELTQEWHDGLASTIMRRAVADEGEHRRYKQGALQLLCLAILFKSATTMFTARFWDLMRVMFVYLSFQMDGFRRAHRRLVDREHEHCPRRQHDPMPCKRRAHQAYGASRI